VGTTELGQVTERMQGERRILLNVVLENRWAKVMDKHGERMTSIKSRTVSICHHKQLSAVSFSTQIFCLPGPGKPLLPLPVKNQIHIK
jgi:hypothetical protein